MFITAKSLSRILILLILLFWQMLGTSSAYAAEFDADVCPDLKSTACLKAIRSAIDNLEYGEARSMAELQCDSSVDLVPSEHLTESILTEQTLGCYYLFVLERFLARSLRALDAHDRAKRMAVFGCEHGFPALCEVLLAFVARNYDDLLAEVSAAIKNEGLGTRLIDIKLRSFIGGRELPKSFVESSRSQLLKVFADQRQPIGSRSSKDGPPNQDLDAELVLSAGDLVLSLKIYDNLAKKIIWQQEWRTRDLEERRRIFGVNTEVPALMVATRRVDLWEPDYNVQFGVGGASIPNTSGTVSDRQRLIVEVRAGERLGYRSWEAGMLLSAHFTEAGLNKNKIQVGQGEESGSGSDNTSDSTDTSSEDAAVEEARRKILTPYKSAYAFYLYLGRHLFGDLSNYKGVRGGAIIGVGGVLTPYFMSGGARLGFDFQIGRRMVLTPAAYWIGGSAIPITKDVTVRTKEAFGGGLVISFAL